MKYIFKLLAFIVALVNTGCEFVGDVFRTGFYSGVFLVVLIVVIIIFGIVTLSKKK
jgi:hypothetical protein